MCRFALKSMGTNVLCLGFILCHLVKGNNIAHFSAPGRPASLPCLYHYEDLSPLPELSVQWRSPENHLLCHYVKHKAFLNCSEGYSLSYRPAQIRLTIGWVQDRDYGTHVCSISKRHEFTDSRFQLLRPENETVTQVPGSGETLSAHCWTLLPSFLLLML